MPRTTSTRLETRRIGLSRRGAIGVALATPFLARAARAETKPLRVGFQKGEPVLMAAKANRDLETLLAPKGVGVEWIEFQFGPPMLEAMRAGGVDVGAVGDTPPIFAQAAHADLLYVASNRGAPQSLLLPPASSIRNLADLKGKKIAFGRGSSAHNFTLLVLEKAGLRYEDVQAVYLGPADAGAAFAQGAIDAWSIWEPYTSLFNVRPGIRTLTTNKEVGEQFSFIMASGAFVRANPDLGGAVVGGFAATAENSRGKHGDVAALLANATGIPSDVWFRALTNDPFEVTRMTDDLTQSQQKVADRFRALGLIPVDIKVSDIVWPASV